MSNPLYQQLNPNRAPNNMLGQFLQFKKTFSGDPRQVVQQMLNSGKITQAQINQYAQQANALYEQFKGFM